MISPEVGILKPMKKKVSITLDEDLIEKVKILAESCDRSFSQYINLIVKEHVNKKES
jgi:predicted transcriptional regulator